MVKVKPLKEDGYLFYQAGITQRLQLGVSP